MEFNVRNVEPLTLRTGCLVVGVNDGRKLSPTAQLLDDASRGTISRALAQGDLGNDTGATLLLRELSGIRATRVLLVRAGPVKGLTGIKFRKVATAAARAIKATGAKDALISLGELTVEDHDVRWKARVLVEASLEATFTYSATKSKPTPSASWVRTTLPAGNRREVRTLTDAAREGAAIGEGKAFAKELGNLPGNICTPSYLADRARQLAKGLRKLQVRVLDEAQLRRMGMGSLLSVSAGSRQPAKLIVLEYNGGRADRRPAVLVGKGVTFDSGGISLKPGATMDEMKFDMCGADSMKNRCQN